MNLFNTGGAKFDVSGKYRYMLWRIWDEEKPFIAFIGLNPSKADSDNDDPTIRRVKKFAYDWGYGGVFMLNLFALVTPYPKELKECEDPIADNDKYLREITKRCKDVLFCWGNFPEAKERARDVIKMFPDAMALIVNKDGTPRHPLYVPGDVKPVKYANNG
jgi:hypothetical protein